MGLSIAFVITILVEIALPVFLVIFVVRKTRIAWMVIVIGVMIYMIAQTIQIPLLLWITEILQNPQLSSIEPWKPLLEGIFMGIMVGIIAEGLRWSAFKYLRQLKSTVPHAIGCGLGYGASETIILVGIPMLISFLNMVVYKNAPTSDPAIQEGLVAQVQALWMLPWYTPLLSAFERISSMLTYVTLSMLVLQVFTNGRWKYLILAMLWHMVLDAIPIVLNGYGMETWVIYLALFAYSGLNLYILIKLGGFDKVHYEKVDTVLEVDAGGSIDV